MVPVEKRCGHCHQVKPRSDFSSSRSEADGLFNWCKVCHSSVRRARYLEVRDENLARQRERYARAKQRRQQMSMPTAEASSPG